MEGRMVLHFDFFNAVGGLRIYFFRFYFLFLGERRENR